MKVRMIASRFSPALAAAWPASTESGQPMGLTVPMAQQSSGALFPYTLCHYSRDDWGATATRGAL